MTADPFSPQGHEPDEPGRVRAIVITAFLLLATVFIYQAMDGVQRATEQAERRQRIARSACHSYATRDLTDDDNDADELLVDDADVMPASATASKLVESKAELPPTSRSAPPTTAPVEAPDRARVVPTAAPRGLP